MEESGDQAADADLAAAMPRVLIEAGRAAAIARSWGERARSARAAGGPAMPRFALDLPLREALFELRRARRVVRGLEAAEETLDREAAGLSRAAATKPSGRRLSRLLVLSDDGSPRFYRQAERLVERHFARLGAIIVEADEEGLGGAVFGGGRRARAILLDHKDAVAMLLDRLAPAAGNGSRGEE